MNSPLPLLAGLFLLGLGSLLHAAIEPVLPAVPFTAKELAQGYRDRVIVARPHAARRTAADADEAREGVRVREKFPRLGDLRVIELDDTDTTDAALARLKATGRYEFVERDHLRHLAVTPSDPGLATQWAINNTGTASGGLAGADIKALAAWDILHDAPNVVVAIIDTGLNLSHQDLAANLWRNPSPTSVGDLNGANFVGGRGRVVSGNPTDDNGHGTHVAGTVGAVGDNGVAVAGVAWRVQLMALKALGGTSGTGAVSDIAAAINYAITHGAHIINASFGESGGTGYSQTELAAITAARDAGVIFVAAAGNDTADLDISPHYPSSHALDNIVTVGSSNRNDFVSSFSNYGSAVDLFAPGESILSLNYTSNTGTTTKSGTSMAAPHVAGALALLRAQFPGDTYRQLINRLLRATDPGDKFTGKAQTNGRLNLLKALSPGPNTPFNDDFAARALLVGGNHVVRSNNAGATTQLGSGEPAHAGQSAGASLWWEWTAPATGSVSIDTSGSAYDTVLAVYTGTSLAALTPVAANDDDGANRTSRLTFTAQAGVTYEIAVAGKGGATGLTLLNLGTTPANDMFATPALLSGPSAHVTASNAHCSREPDEPRIAVNGQSFAGGLSLWYRWTAPKSGRIQVAALSNDFDPILAVYTGSALNALTLVTSGDNTGADNTQTGALATFNATAGVTYLLSVDAKSAATIGQFTLSLTDSLWQAVTAGSITGSPAIARDGTLYVGSTYNNATVDNSLYAFNPDGSLKWTFPTQGIIDTCSPAVAEDGTIYVGAFDGKLYAINPDGTQKWAHDFGATFTAANSPSLAADGTIYVKPSDGFLYALNPADGTTKWRRDVHGTASYASASIAPDGTIYQGSDDYNLYAVNPDGSLKWTFRADAEIYTVPALDTAGNIYFSVLSSGKLYSVTPAGVQRWVYSGATSSSTSSPALSADSRTVYFGGYDKKLHAVDTATGAARWTYPLGDEVRASSPAVDANGTIYIGCYDYRLYAINADGTLRRTYDMGNWLRSCPAIFGTSLYVGSNDGKLYAFDLGVGAAVGPWSQYRANPRRLGRAVSETFAIVTQPQSQTAVLGLPLTLSVIASGGGTLTYQWTKDGTDLAGATSASYSVTSATFANAGSYSVRITSAQVTLTSTPARVTVEPMIPGRLTNLSVRTTAGTGAQTLIVGFNLAGSTAKSLLIRGIGPTLAAFGVTGALADPQLTLVDGNGATRGTNSGWNGDPAIGSAAARVGAFPLAPTSKDAALLRDLAAGSYTAQITGTGTTGIALAEIYDADPTPAGAQTLVAISRLTNVSARAQVGTGADILIAGFTINGNVPKKILLRAVGPSLSQFGVTGRLADPRLEIFNSRQHSVATNDDWAGDPALSAAFASVGAFTFTSARSLDAARLVTLAPGSYTVQVTGANNTTGVALVEVYEVP